MGKSAGALANGGFVASIMLAGWIDEFKKRGGFKYQAQRKSARRKLSSLPFSLRAIRSGATKGARLVDQAGTTMGSIVESVERVASIIGEIMNATREQTSGIGEINMAVTQMDQATQQNAALVEEAAAASESMQEQAVQLAQVVSVFHLGTEAANVGVLNVGVLLDSRSERLAVPASKSRTLSVASANG